MSSDTGPISAAIESANALQSRFNIFTSIEDPVQLAPSADGPLSGIPIAIKDLIDHEGRVTTCGSAFYRHQAVVSATAITNLERDGASVIGRTGLHEFAFGFSSENPHFGPVRNPWDPKTSPGGSSGGSGAAVAAGVVPIAIGTDTGGSVRVPAALCGCFGLKVTFGAIPIEGVFPLVPSIDTVGPLANSAKNIELAYRAMAGERQPLPPPRRVRLGIPMPWYETAPMSDQVRAGFAAAVTSLEELGHEVHPLELPDIQPDRRISFAIGVEAAAIHAQFRSEGRQYGADVAERLDAAADVSEREAEEGRKWQQLIRQRFDDAFAVVDFLLTPTVPTLRKLIGEEMIGDNHYRTVLSWFTAIVNHALLPAISLPCVGPGDPPISLQLIGPMNSDLALISLAGQLESAGVVGFRAAPELDTGTFA